MDTVYEIVDYTDDEKYFTLGIFETAEQALDEIDKAERRDSPISEFCDGEYEEIQVLKRKIGWSQHGTTIKTIKRQEFYDEDKDEYYWKRV